jgi:hypothetical protein
MRQRGGIQQGYMALTYDDTDAPLAAQVQSFLQKDGAPIGHFVWSACASCLMIRDSESCQKRENARVSKNGR